VIRWVFAPSPRLGLVLIRSVLISLRTFQPLLAGPSPARESVPASRERAVVQLSHAGIPGVIAPSLPFE